MLGLPNLTKLAAAAIMGLIVSSQAIAEAGCKPINGHFDEHQLTPLPSFTSRLSIIGGIQGEGHFTLTSLIPATPPSVLLFTGTTVITTKDGDLHLTDAGAANTAFPGPLVDLETIIGGTGAFTGASGHIFISEFFDFATGMGSGDYKGEVCTP